MKFKVGDRVRCISESDIYLDIQGELGTVQAVLISAYPYCVLFDCYKTAGSMIADRVSEDDLELVEEA
jgi:hypothetical protein